MKDKKEKNYTTILIVKTLFVLGNLTTTDCVREFK